MLRTLLGGLALAFAAGPSLAGAVHAAGKTSPPIPPLLQPADGYWYDPERPGTGFTVGLRDDTLGLVFFHYSDVEGEDVRVADWHLASGTLAYDTFEAPLLHFAGGSCLGCTPYSAADAEQTEIVVRLVFASAREATLQIDDGEPRRVVAMAYGVPYAVTAAAPPGLPLPDLRGRWLLDVADDQRLLHLTTRTALESGGIEFRGTAHGQADEEAWLTCGDSGAASCALTVAQLPLHLFPVPVAIAHFPIGDITEERMIGADGLTSPVRAFRIDDAQVQP